MSSTHVFSIAVGLGAIATAIDASVLKLSLSYTSFLWSPSWMLLPSCMLRQCEAMLSKQVPLPMMEQVPPTIWAAILRYCEDWTPLLTYLQEHYLIDILDLWELQDILAA